MFTCPSVTWLFPECSPNCKHFPQAAEKTLTQDCSNSQIHAKWRGNIFFQLLRSVCLQSKDHISTAAHCHTISTSTELTYFFTALLGDFNCTKRANFRDIICLKNKICLQWAAHPFLFITQLFPQCPWLMQTQSAMTDMKWFQICSQWEDVTLPNTSPTFAS